MGFLVFEDFELFPVAGGLRLEGNIPDSRKRMEDFSVFEGLEDTFYIFPTDRKRDVKALTELILDHGGKVVDFHDREPTDVALKRARGYALIDPSQVYAPSLFVRQSLEDDDGNVVLWYMNWGYPQLCIDEKMVAEAEYARDALILTQKINLDGWVFCLSPLLDFDDARRKKVEKKVMVGGGIIVDKEADATIVIVPDQEIEEQLGRYLQNPKTRVESYSWLEKTLRKRKYVRFSYVPKARPMPGRPPGQGHRTEFTAEDDRNLAQYLALHGSLEGGGRQGRLYYQELCSNPQKWPWASRHTPSSWVGRYRTHKERFDKMIATIIQNDVPFRDRHGQDPRTRLANKKAVRHSNVPSRQTPVQSGSVEPEAPEAKGSEEGDAPDIEAPVESQPEDQEAQGSSHTVPLENEEPVEDIAEDRNDASYHTAENDQGIDFDEPFEDLSALPKSTPPRRETSLSTQATLVNNNLNGSNSARHMHGLQELIKSRNPYDFSAYNPTVRGIYNFADDDHEVAGNKSHRRESESIKAGQGTELPHLDMREYQPKNKVQTRPSTRSARKIREDTDDEEEYAGDDGVEIPARSLYVSGRVKRSRPTRNK